MEEGYIALIRAVIHRAEEDYRIARRRLRRRCGRKAAREELAEIEAFLRSGRLMQYAGVDGEAILTRLKEETEHDDAGIPGAGADAGEADRL